MVVQISGSDRYGDDIEHENDKYNDDECIDSKYYNSNYGSFVMQFLKIEWDLCFSNCHELAPLA